MADDPVKAIKLLDQIAELLKEFKNESSGLQDQNGKHPINDVMSILFECRQIMFIRYGKMLWFTSDGPIHKPLGKKIVPDMSEEVLPSIRNELGTEDVIETLENGRSFQRFLRGLDRSEHII